MTDSAATLDEGFDVIGDVHGQSEKLIALLGRMGYAEVDGVWRHPRRRAVFVGDLIDRGAGQIDCYRIPRAMVEAGSARLVAGNHEYNAVAFHTEDPDHPGEYLRPHTEENLEQHAAFLDQVGRSQALHDEIIDWFRTLPLWLELDGLRVVHACWDPASIALLRELTSGDDSLTGELLVASSRMGEPAWHAVEHVLKGPEIDVPRPYLDPGGRPRHRARYCWWDPEADQLDRAVVLPATPKGADGEAYGKLPSTPIEPPVPPYTDAIPVVYGHYWRTGTPVVSSDRTACVDYSAGRDGPLVAYRWSGESVLSNQHFASSADVMG